MITNIKKEFLDSTDQYLVIIASTLPKNIDPTKEIILNKVIEKYPYANVYENNKKISPGTIEIVGDGELKRHIIIIYGQIYVGKMTYPGDDKERRLDWFYDGLDRISEISDLKSVSFPSQIARDGGGNWSQYYQAIGEFNNNLNMKSKVDVKIYQNDEDHDQERSTQVSLLNCIDLTTTIRLEDIYISNMDKVELSKVKPNITKIPVKKSKINLSSMSKKKMEAKCEQLSSFPKTKLNSDWTVSLIATMMSQVDQSWFDLFKKNDMIKKLMEINSELCKELEKEGDRVRFLPACNHIFWAFHLCPWNELKVVILGQDPYFSSLDEAMGLSFSVPKGVKIPPSLINIFKEIKSCIKGYQIPHHGDLSDWARKGVLLLNSSLTVKYKKKECHMNIWKSYADEIIRWIDGKDSPIVFMLWGNYAQKKGSIIRNPKHLVLQATHPSPLGANKGGWFGSGHFELCNRKLRSAGLEEIDWQT